MKKLLVFLFPLLSVVCAYSSDRLEHKDVIVKNGEYLNRDIITDKSVTIDGEIAGNCISFSGDVIVRGIVRGDIVSFGGKVLNSGEVNGDMVLIGSDGEFSGIVNKNLVVLGGKIRLKTNTVVNGDTVLIGAKIEKEDNVKVKQVINLEIKPLSALIKYVPELVRYLPKNEDRGEEKYEGVKSLLFSSGIMWGILVFILSFILLVLAFILVPLAFFAKRLQVIGEAIKTDFWTVTGVGTLIFVLIFPVFLIMLVSIIGILLIPFAIIFLIAAHSMGFAGFSVVFAEKFFEIIKQKAPDSIILKGIIGYLIIYTCLALGILMPFIGWIFFMVFSVLFISASLSGLGAVFKTKMGKM